MSLIATHRTLSIARAACVLVAVAALAPSVASATVEPEIVFETARKLEVASVDTATSFPADGQTLDRHGMRAVFSEGSFRAIRREDDRVVGLVFEGVGAIEVGVPAGVETTAWQAYTDFSPLNQPITAAYFRFSDLTADDLRGERAWAEDADADSSSFRIHEARAALLDDPQWTRRAPHLLIDRLTDLYGGGAVGGHLLIDFRLGGDGPPLWLSYYHNPRGALMEGETTAWYRLRKQGAAPPLLSVLASFGDSASADAPYDVAFTDIDVTFPTSPGSRDMLQANVVAEVGLVALAPEGIQAVVLELESIRKLCMAQPQRLDIRVRKVTDHAGNSLAAIHRKNRLLIPLAGLVPQGQSVNLTIEYEGPMTQGIPTGPPDTMFSELGPWAWYPRNPRIDRFASKVTAHMPRYIRAIAPGDLVEEREEKEGWHYTYEEPGGVRNLTLVFGDFVKTPDNLQGASPRIIAWVPRDVQETVKDMTAAARTMVNVMNGLWGGYPYTTLHVVANSGHPYNNWSFDADGKSGSWVCLPNDYAHPWEPYTDRPSGMMMGSVISPPAYDVIEERLMGRLVTEGLSVGAYLQFIDLARQWWGHMVPPKTYRDLWLTEALATWTGLVYLSAASGKDAVREKAKTLHDLANEGGTIGLPLALGARLDRAFLMQGWGVGPLLISTLVDDVGGGPFLRVINTLINRASGPGISTEVFLETLGSVAPERAVQLVEQVSQRAGLPRVEYVTEINKDAGSVELTFTQIDDPLPLSVPVELIWSPKKRETRTVRLNGPVTATSWPMDDLPKRIVVDPLGMALVQSLKKGKALESTP